MAVTGLIESKVPSRSSQLAFTAKSYSMSPWACRDHDLLIIALGDGPDTGLRELRPQRGRQYTICPEEQPRCPHLHRLVLLAGGPDPLDLAGQVRRRGDKRFAPLIRVLQSSVIKTSPPLAA